MGRKRPQTPIFVQDIVVKSRSFPLFPPSFQHSTSVLHMPRGKKAHTPPFHNSSTAPSPKQRPQKIRMAAKRRRVFNTLPSPYYCYYNKYNKKQGKKPCIQQQTMRTLWGKRIKQPSGSGLRTESGQRSGRKERKVDPPPCVRFCQLHRENSGRSPDRSPLPRQQTPETPPRAARRTGKRPFCCVYKYSKYCEYRCGAPQAVRRKPLRKKEQTLDKKEIDHFEYHL